MVRILIIPKIAIAKPNLGITPFVNPEDLKFYFQEIYRLGGG